MNLIDLGIPKFRRKYKDRPAPPVVVPCDLCFEGEKAAEFVNDVLAKNPHFADGIENAPQAFIDMLRGGKYTGKVVVRLGNAAQ